MVIEASLNSVQPINAETGIRNTPCFHARLTVEVASSIEEYVTLLEAGFTYVSDYGKAKVLRKRK